MTYREAMGYMEQIQKRGSVLGLSAVKNLLERLHNPQEQLSVIHVAGTNGKGSICTFLEYLYRAEGKRVGRYLSPTLHCYLERFQINGGYMEEDTFAALVTELYPILEEMKQEGRELPTAFEIETAIAFLFFVRSQVDIVILETGMGGRMDATNVVSHPLCTVFAEIGMDHMQFLGETIEKITHEKAGIMKDSCPVVIYPNEALIVEQLKKEAGLHKIEKDMLRVISKEDVQILSESLEGTDFIYRGEPYHINLMGTFQVYNAVTAIETKLLLDGALYGNALADATWEGRFEKVSDKPFLIRDGAHNIDGAKALKESIQKHFTNYKIIFIIGVLKDKEYGKMMEMLCPMAESVYTITPECERGLEALVLKQSVLPYCEKVSACNSLLEALMGAKKDYQSYVDVKEPAVIVAWGSLSYIGQITDELDKW